MNYNNNVTTKIIFANIIVFVLIELILASINSPKADKAFMEWTALSMNNTIFSGKIWELITYGFLHANVMHIFWNMILLYFVGSIAETILGAKKFTQFYFAAIAASGLGYLIGPDSHVFCIGASGAIFAVFCFAAIERKSMIIYFFGIIKMKLFTLFAIFLGINIFTAITGTAGSTAVFCHLGGALFGYIYHKYIHREQKCINIKQDYSELEL